MYKLHKKNNVQISSAFNIKNIKQSSISRIFIFIQNINKQIKKLYKVYLWEIFHAWKF